MNLAYSADHLAPELLWTGKFMDGGHHWTDRGIGAERPAGENIITLSSTRTLPEEARFKGYKLDPAGNPTFAVQIGAQILLDSWKPSTSALVRTLSLNGTGADAEILISDHPLDGKMTLKPRLARSRRPARNTTSNSPTANPPRSPTAGTTNSSDGP